MRAFLRQIGNISIIDISGKITIGEGDIIIRDKVNDLLSNGNINIIINLAKVRYIDSGGVGELVACLKRAKEKGGIIKLLNPSSKVYDVFQIVNIGSLFETFSNEEEALNSF